MNFAIASTPDERRRTFHALDAARGVAALLVVLHHLPADFRGTFVGSGSLAVDFFFGLSGFVLAHAYLSRLADGRLGVRDFMVARLVRLYPLYLISLLSILVLCAALYVAGIPPPWSAFAMAGKLPFAFLMLPSPTLDWQAYLYPFNIAAWSIFMELLVNLVFALVCRPVSRPGFRWMLIGVSGLLLFVQLMVQDVLGGASWNLLAAGLPRVCFSFFLGIQIHEWLRHRRTAAPIHSGWGLAALGVLVAILGAPDELWLKLVAIFAVFPVLMLVLGASDVPRGLAGAALRKLGVLSYAIYMMHGPVLFAWLMLYLTPEARATISGLVALPFLASVLLASWATDRWLDVPVRARITQYLRDRKTRLLYA
ncbi:MAG: acyltransferase [Variovorax sp.]|nr:MAG: acyltransferase [Variovorax sp.]